MESGKGNFNLLMENAGSEAVDDGFFVENAGPEAVDSGLLMENADAGSEEVQIVASSTVKLAFAKEKSCDLEQGKMVSVQQSASGKVSETTVDSTGTGTVLCAIVLPKGVLMSSDARITNMDSTKISYPEKKLWEIREKPPIYSSWCHYNRGGVAFMEYLKLEAGNRTLADLVEVAVDHLKYEITENFNLQCYICSVEREVPKAYVISRFCDIVHIKNCKADGCRCSVFDIKCWSRELNYGVYCMGSGAKYASNSLKYSFKGNSEYIDNTNECNIELLKINKSVKFEKADDAVLLAMLVSSFRIVSCGAPYLVSRIPCVGESDLNIHDFLPILKRCFSLLGHALDNSVFLIYRQVLEGSNFGEVVVENMIGKSDVDGNGFAVAVLGGDYVLHLLRLIDGNCMKNVLTLFDPLTADQEVPNVHLFCLNPATLRFGKLDMRRIEEREVDHGINYAEVNDMEYVFLGLPTIDFLDSLIEVGAETLLQ